MYDAVCVTLLPDRNSLGICSIPSEFLDVLDKSNSYPTK